MQEQTLKKILQLNTDFYTNVAQSFSTSRAYAWKGWGKVLELLKTLPKDKNFDVLDIGCGNGRFGNYLFSNLKTNQIHYTGVDSNETLLEHAKHELALHSDNTQIEKLDAILNLNLIKDKHDVITAFGLMHHIPSKDLRLSWLKEVTSMLKPNGYLVLTFWNFDEEIALKVTSDISKGELEVGDYFLTWENNPQFLRYCHFYKDDEHNEIDTLLGSLALKLVDQYYSDGKDNKQNLYKIWHNTNK